MEKALEKIKEIIDFCDAVGCHRAIYESIKFVEKELEEAQLTRREWYQKGYNEAMKHKECCLICKDRSGCKFADNVRDNFGINSNEMWFSCFKTKDIK